MNQCRLLLLTLFLCTIMSAQAQLTYDFNATTGTLTIGGTADSEVNAAKVNEKLNRDYTQPIDNTLKQVKFTATGITSIGNDAFRNCASLVSITFPSSVTSIGSGAISGCSAMLDVELPSGLKTIGDFVFARCSSLVTIIIPASVTSIGYSQFEKDPALRYIISKNPTPPTLGKNPVWDDAMLPDIISIYVPIGAANAYKEASNWNDPKFKRVYECAININTATSAIEITSGTIEGVVITKQMIDLELKLAKKTRGDITKITLAGSGITTIDTGAFQLIPNLTEVLLPPNLRTLGYWALSNNIKLRAITLPSKVSLVEKSQFDNCPELKSITCTMSTAAALGSDVFFGAPLSKVTLIVPVGKTEEYKSKRWHETHSATSPFKAIVECSYDMSSDGTMTISGVGNGVMVEKSAINTELARVGKTRADITMISYSTTGSSSIEAEAFLGCSALTSITLPSGVTTIGSKAFAGCSKLTSIICKMNTAVTLPADALTSRGAITLYVPLGTTLQYNNKGWKDKQGDPTNGFTAIKERPIYTLNTNSGVLTISGAGSTGITIEKEAIDAELLRLNKGRDAITQIVFEATGLTSIRPSAFANCTKLSSVTIREGITKIESSSFSGCSLLTNITLPSTITSIEASAFANCSALMAITSKATAPPKLIATSFTNVNQAKCTVFVPFGCIDSYQADNLWKGFTLFDISPVIINSLTDITSTGLTVNWEVLAGATSYGITLTNPSGTIIKSATVLATAPTSAELSELSEQLSSGKYTVTVIGIAEVSNVTVKTKASTVTISFSPSTTVTITAEEAGKPISVAPLTTVIVPSSNVTIPTITVSNQGILEMTGAAIVKEMTIEVSNDVSLYPVIKGSGNANIDLKALYVTRSFEKEKFYAISFPFNTKGVEKWNTATKQWVAITTIYNGTNSADIDCFFQEYDGATRATGVPGWKPLQSLSLQGNKGYTFYSMKEGGKYRFVANGTGTLFTTSSTVTLTALGYKVDETKVNKANNQGWNFMGSPYVDKVTPQTIYTACNQGDGGKSVFVEELAQTPFRSFTAYFVQVADTMEISHARTLPVSKSVVAEQDIITMDYQMGDHTAHSYLIVREDATMGYEIGKDLVKTKSNVAAYAEMWQRESDLDIAINDRPLADDITTIPLTLKSGAAGSYLFGLSTLPNHSYYNSISLVNTATGKTYELKDGQRVAIEQTADQTNTDYALRISKIVTHIEQQTGAILIYSSRDMLMVEGVALGAVIELYDMQGSLLVREESHGSDVTQIARPIQGAIIVRITAASNVTHSKIIL